MDSQQRQELLSAPYRLRGRDPKGIDCLGVVLYILAIRGDNAMDPWKNLIHEWKTGTIATASAFPCDWVRVHEGMQEGDVGVFHGEHSWAAIVYAGEVWSAHPNIGVWCKPLRNFKQTPNEVWRHDPC